jgi:hypothetical protein
MNEIDAVIDVLSDELLKIYNSYKSYNKRTGDIGEEFAKSVIKQVFLDRKCILYYQGYKTFRTYTQINANHRGRGGIDIFLDFIDTNGKPYYVFIEMKNWDYYLTGISDKWYREKIRQRFFKNDPNKKRYWVVVMNRDNIEYIQRKCRNDKINILPIDELLYGSNLKPKPLKQIFLHFKSEIESMVDLTISGDLIKS